MVLQLVRSLSWRLRCFVVDLILRIMSYRYTLTQAVTDEDFKEWQKLYMEVYGDEVGIYTSSVYNLEFRRDFLLLLRYRNRVIGSIVINVFDANSIPGDVRKTYQFDKFSLENIEKFGELSKFMLIKKHRNDLSSPILLRFVAQYSQKFGYPCFYLGLSNPGLVHNYSKLGVFFYTKCLQADSYGDLVIPFVYPIFDLTYLRQMKAIHYLVCKSALKYYIQDTSKFTGFMHGLPVVEYFDALSLNEFTDLNQVRSELNHADKREVVDFLIPRVTKKDILLVHVTRNTKIIREDEMDTLFYIILKGTFLMKKNGTIVKDLFPGEIFGEEVFINNQHKHFFSIECLEEGVILMVKSAFIQRYKGECILPNLSLLHWIQDEFNQKLKYYQVSLTQEYTRPYYVRSG